MCACVSILLNRFTRTQFSSNSEAFASELLENWNISSGVDLDHKQLTVLHQ